MSYVPIQRAPPKQGEMSRSGSSQQLDDNVERIKQQFPEASRDVIREELKRNRNDVQATINTLRALVHVAKLRKEFPKMSADVVAHIFKKNNGDRDEAAAELAQLVLDYHKMKLQKRNETLKKSGGGSGASSANTSSNSLMSGYDEQLSPRRDDDEELPLETVKLEPIIQRAPAPAAQQHQQHSQAQQQQQPLKRQSNEQYSSSNNLTIPKQTQSPPPVVQQQQHQAQQQPQRPQQPQPPRAVVQYDTLPANAAEAAAVNAGSGLEQARALYDYQTGQPTKLNFFKGDVINLSDSSGDAWWHGSINDQVGKFPKTYVRPLANEIKAQALYDFGEKDGHLRFKRDDIIVLLNKRKGSQWWEGVLESGSPVGIFRNDA